MHDEIEVDERGRYTDCHFYKKRGCKAICECLKAFYNFEPGRDMNKLCCGCPFFKTDEEYNKGFRKGLIETVE